MTNPANQTMGWQYYFKEKIEGRKSELSSFNKIVIRAKASNATSAKLSLITEDAFAYAATVSLSKDWQNIEVPLSSLQQDSFLLLPRPYPGFQPLTFRAAGTSPFDLKEAEKLEVSFGNTSGPLAVEVESVWLEK